MKKTITVCDNCEKNISSTNNPIYRGCLMGAIFDLCEECSSKMNEVKQKFGEAERKMFEQEKEILKLKLPKIFEILEDKKE